MVKTNYANAYKEFFAIIVLKIELLYILISFKSTKICKFN